MAGEGAPGLQFPIKIRSDIRAFLAAELAGEAGLDVGQPNVVWPAIAADRGPMAALVIRAIDQETANTTCVHFSECDLLAGEGGHDRTEAQYRPKNNPLWIAALNYNRGVARTNCAFSTDEA